jgi:nitrate reductase / nitrite oxidoreductase, alpha subunit
VLSFYDWYCDLPPASPRDLGRADRRRRERRLVQEPFIAVVGSNVLMTRTPDAHFLVEARHQGDQGGGLLARLQPDLQGRRRVDPPPPGQDGAFWMAVGHVLLKEFHVERRVPYFREYLKKYSDGPFLVELEAKPDGGNGSGPRYRAGKMLRASRLAATREVENAEWKLFVLDEATASSGCRRAPSATAGREEGEWNLRSEDSRDRRGVRSALTLDGCLKGRPCVAVEFDDFTDGEGESVRSARSRRAGAPRRDRRRRGPVTTAIRAAPRAVRRRRDLGEAEGDWPTGYDDDAHPFTPPGRSVHRRQGLGRGRLRAPVGPDRREDRGALHGHHRRRGQPLVPQQPDLPRGITALMVTGCIGKNGGGWNHYVGQEKLVPQASWAPIAFATDWGGPPRLQNTPSFHYMHSDQWRYDRPSGDVPGGRRRAPDGGRPHGRQAGAGGPPRLAPLLPAVRPLEQLRWSRGAGGGRETPEAIGDVAEQLASRKLRFSMEDPTTRPATPRVWYIWRGNALQASAKGHEYFLEHYLGTDNASSPEEAARDEVHEVVWHEHVEPGKLDLVVDLNFRMDTSALYSDVVLPAATYYEKDDLNTTDLHSFIHPLQAAVPPCWESKSDWRIFREIAWHTGELLRRSHFPEPVEDVVATPLLHDTPAEIAQPRSWTGRRASARRCRARPCPTITVVERDYANLYQPLHLARPQLPRQGPGRPRHDLRVDDLYDATGRPTPRSPGTARPTRR